MVQRIPGNLLFNLLYQDKNLAPGLEQELKADYPVSHKTIEDFDKLYGGVGPANYHWYQQKFAQLGFM
jgi:hypothetical protein